MLYGSGEYKYELDQGEVELREGTPTSASPPWPSMIKTRSFCFPGDLPEAERVFDEAFN
jgi:hypothetical protein